MSIIKQYHKDTNTTYVYESTSYWVPELGQPRSKRKLIGKIDPKTGEMIPTGKRGPKPKRAEVPVVEEDTPSQTIEFVRLQQKYNSLLDEMDQKDVLIMQQKQEIEKLKNENLNIRDTARKTLTLFDQVRKTLEEI